MKNSFSSFLALIVLSLFAVSCGSPSNVLDNVEVKTEVKDQDVFLTFSADLDLGAMSFASISVPILHPRGQTPIGQLHLTSQLGGTNKLTVALNVSEVADVQTTQAVLPNGNLIPLIANNPTIAVDIGNGAKVYLTVGTSTTAIGVAVPIKEFDSIGRSLPGLNVFPIVNKNGFIGTAGIFTGVKSGTSGIAVVADISSAMRGIDFLSVPSGIQADEASDEVIILDYRSQSVSKSSKSKLDDRLYDLNKKKAKLRLH